MLLTLLKDLIGLETKTQFIICAERHQMQFWNLSLMECLFQEQKKERFIREPLEANLLTMEKEAKPIDAVLLPIEPGTQCYILYLEEPWDITAHSLLSTL